MPRRDDLKKVVILGSGPIRIGQAAEFDFSGSQACRALRADGYEIVLINSNPATIQNDPEMADKATTLAAGCKHSVVTRAECAR